MRNNLFYFLVVFVCFLTQVQSQNWIGFQGSSYAGSQNLFYNPAEIVDSRYKVDINLVGVGTAVSNNYIYLDRSFLFGKSNYFDLPQSVKDTIDIQYTYFKEIFKNRDKSVYFNTNIYGPSFHFTFGKKNNNAIGLFTKGTVLVNLDKVSPQLAQLSWYGLDYPALWQQDIDEKQLAVNGMAWTEYGLTYGRVLYDKGDHLIRAAVSPKITMGIFAASLFTDNLSMNFKNSDTLTIYNADVQYGHAENFSFDDNYTFEFSSKPSFAIDLGVVYEWRPNKDKYTYDMDCKTGIPRKDKDKYTLKAGLSIMDIGRLKFEKGYLSDNFTASITDWRIGGFKFDGLGSLDDTINSRFNYTGDKKSFNTWLPLRLNFFVDYNIGKGFYVNASGNISPRFKNASQVHHITTFAVTPRYDHAWFGAALPINFDLQSNVNLGVNLRLGPLWIGTSDITAAMGKKKIKAADVYFALHIPIPHKLPGDRDKDKMSNKVDKCKKEAGTCASGGCPDKDNDGVVDISDKCPDIAGPADLGGCPDKDGDKIIDKEDDCSDEAGKIELKGCPDKDNDGIADKVDKCPEAAGTKEFNGCPDSDKDGLPDPDDDCPNEYGKKEFKGCPDKDNDGLMDKEDRCPDIAGPKEFKGCPDSDADGLSDPDDNCPKIAGPISNKGCPEIKKEVIEKFKKAAQGIFFETGKDKLKTVSYPALNVVADMLAKDKTLNLDIEGHTDNVGKPEMNMDLSQRRANTAMNYLITKGVDPARMTAKGYGDTRPVADNATSLGKQQNRRVEFIIRN